MRNVLVMNQLCEACESAPAELAEACDNPNEPYHLCFKCCERLHVRTLRPVEWYNLAKRHGPGAFLLHDDFYDEDGTATQPEEDVEAPDRFPAPTFAEVAQVPEKLLDYSITRWHFDAELSNAWSALPQQAVLETLSRRFAASCNGEVRSTVLLTCASALHELGADLVRYAWGETSATISFASLGKASANCLPFREGFDRVASAIAESKSRARDLIYALSYFRSPEALDWIERQEIEPITESWGYLAAASKLEWTRVEKWLEVGRPLSLVAIDALRAIVKPMTPLLREYAPRLHQPPTLERFRQVLSEYAERDRVPRVQFRINQLLSESNSLTKGGVP